MSVADSESQGTRTETEAGHGNIDQRAVEAGINALNEQLADSNPISAEGLAAAAAAAAGIYVPGEGDISEVLGKCLIRENLTEVVEEMAVGSDPNPGLGTLASYVDGFFLPDGKRIGTARGSALVLGMTPHMWQLHQGIIELDDGHMRHVGVIDATAVVHGITQVLSVIGIDGVYEGKSGFRTLVISDPERQPPLYETTFALC